MGMIHCAIDSKYVVNTMSAVGKIIGGLLGFSFAGPFGAILGFVIGHYFDKGISAPGPFSAFRNLSAAKKTFFDATFLVMGHVAKADGHVSRNEIRAAEAIMRRLGLTGTLREEAIQCYKRGKDAAFNLTDTLNELRQACHAHPVLLELFLQLQLQAAMADGTLSPHTKHVLNDIYSQLGFNPGDYQQFEAQFHAEQAFYERAQQYQRHYQQHSSGQSQYNRHTRGTQGPSLNNAYQVLGIQRSASDKEVKQAYRKLMSKHHPDKLVAKGLPEEMIKIANEKTYEIRAAYDAIMENRG